MKKLIIYFIPVFLLFNLSGCTPSKEGTIMLTQSKKGMIFNGLKESRALEVVEVIKATFPELGKTKIISIKFDNQEKSYYVVPEHYMTVTSESTAEIAESYLVASDLSWVEYRSNGKPNVKRTTNIGKNI